SSKDAIIGHSLDGTIDSWNPGAERLLGYPKAEMLRRNLSQVAPSEHEAEIRELLRTCGEIVHSAESEMAWQHKDGSMIKIAMTCSPVRDRSGHVVAGSTIARDVSQHARANAHRNLMLQELNHRVKNSLASVQAIALHTLSSATTLADFKPAFMARLMALSNTHNLLAEDAWSSVGLREIIASELAPYDHDGKGCADLAGEDVLLDPNTALALAMAMHELATNAGKYGALSVPEGRVAVDWDTRRVDGGTRLRLRWCERHGPAVVPPQRKGFGSRLITEGMTMELDGTATLAFEPTGLVCCIDIPLAAPEETA
ncbi:MAG: PAS domain S-box protein, partial [Pseudomonadota bacterium]|nr:PAS domain S-box protein [Pseudomonadota bacterium]